ncbi:condensation domain-containing protein [Vibrio sp.]|uniref:condensation domain-containing protein n=1 Tax=Vibrio sp. TaxID=678 RepID=UPI003F6BCC1F
MQTALPVNFLDKVKFEIAKYNNPQYFVQFWQLDGHLDNQRLKIAFEKVYKAIPKLQTKLVYQDNQYLYQAFDYQNNFLLEETELCPVTALQVALNNNFEQLVSQANFAPFIAIKFDKRDSDKSVLCLLINHIFCDAPSGYLFREQLAAEYNNANVDLSDTTLSLSDEEFIQQQVSGNAAFNKAIEQQRSLSSCFLSEANQVNLFYREDTNNAVIFDFFDIDTATIKRPEGMTLNTLLASAIAKAVMKLKADTLQGSISMSITTNVRQNEDKLFGNFVSAIPVKLEQGEIEHIAPALQQQINSFKMNPLRALVSYAGFATSFANATPEQLMNGFRLISSKSNLYISNFGHYNRDQDERLEFSGSTTIRAGGFNFPLQGHYGLIVTLVPYDHKVSIGIAVSPSIFNKQDLGSFKSQVGKYLS